VKIGFATPTLGGAVSHDAEMAEVAVKQGAVSGRRVAAFVTARHLLSDGVYRPSPEETLAVAEWLSSGRIAAEDEDEEEIYEEGFSPVQMIDWWAPVRLLRKFLP
jgi:hypothetical protein